MAIKRWALAFDVHADEKISDEWRLFKKMIAKVKFDGCCLGGDFGNISSLSHWNKNKRKTAEGMRYMKECRILNRELDYLQKHIKKIVYCEGNHEDWVNQYIEHNPETEGIMELPIMLQLKNRGIEWVKMNNLYKLGKLYITHGMYTNQYHAKKHLEKLGCNVAYGHVHCAQSFQQNQKMQDPYMAFSIPCLCNHAPEYLKNKPANWMSGFADVYIDTNTGNFTLKTINIVDCQFVLDGRLWKL